MCTQVLLSAWATHSVQGEVKTRQLEQGVRCAWAKFEELLLILTARGASYHMKGKILRACVQSVLTYGTDTWAMKAENLQNLGRAERMMVRWMCGVTLKDRKQSEVLYNFWVFRAWPRW